MEKVNRVFSLSSLLKIVGLLVLALATAGVAPATNLPNIQGRWEFAVTSGDSAAQTAAMGQTTFSTYLLQTGSSLSNIPLFTTDTVACDTESRNNVTVDNSSIDGSGNVTVAFTVTLADSTSFQYVFTGIYTAGTVSTPTRIDGTYLKSPGCTAGTLGTGTSDGTFTATYFPDLNGTWAGAFDAPDTGAGPTSVPATFSITTNADETLSGTVTVTGTLTNASSVACLAGPVTLQANMTEGVSSAEGAYFELFGTDTAGTRLWVNATATNPDGSTAAVGEDNPADINPSGTANDGTNNTYTALYGITGGPCDGMGGGDAPFQLVRPKKAAPKKPSRPNRNAPRLGGRKD